MLPQGWNKVNEQRAESSKKECVQRLEKQTKEEIKRSQLNAMGFINSFQSCWHPFYSLWALQGKILVILWSTFKHSNSHVKVTGTRPEQFYMQNSRTCNLQKASWKRSYEHKILWNPSLCLPSKRKVLTSKTHKDKNPMTCKSKSIKWSTNSTPKLQTSNPVASTDSEKKKKH